MEGRLYSPGLLAATEERRSQAEMGADWQAASIVPARLEVRYAGRVFRGAPAPTNLRVPPYAFVAEAGLVIGEDKERRGPSDGCAPVELDRLEDAEHQGEWRKHAAEYYAPKNFNFWYFFGSLALLVLVIQIVSGIF